jgi:hypothetical protein
MKELTLHLECAGEMDCPKEIVMWNYYDHEHLIGTHYKLYDKARIIAERGDIALVYRRKRMPFLPIYAGGIAMQIMEGDTMKTYHQELGFLLEMQARFEDLPNNRCRVTVTYEINTHPIFKIFEPVFKFLFTRWFWATWHEDAPMRLRRWKVHQLGFKDFQGIDYINNKQAKPQISEIPKYEFKPPVKSLRAIRSALGEERPFVHSIELGYKEA